MKRLFETEVTEGEKMQSAYDTTLWTTCKQRKELELRTIDYITYTDLNVVSYQEPPAHEKVVQDGGLPNKLIPSDHLPMYAQFTFKEK